MKYIKKLNIDFNDWNEIDYNGLNKLNNDNKFIIFNSVSSERNSIKCFIGYISYIKGDYKLNILNDTIYYDVDLRHLQKCKNSNEFCCQHIYYEYYFRKKYINFDELDRNKVIIVGEDFDLYYIIDNLDKFVMEDKKYNIKYIMKK